MTDIGVGLGAGGTPPLVGDGVYDYTVLRLHGVTSLPEHGAI